MRKNGFTLIELLAVIVILAIISLIAIPIVLNIINDSKSSSQKESIKMYGKAVEDAVANYLLINPNDKEITLAKIEKYINYSGEKVECTDTKIYANGKIYLGKCSVGGTEITYTYGEKEKTLCTLAEDTGETGLSIGDKYKYKVNNANTFNFYVLSIENDKVNLIMDRNICEDGTAATENNICTVKWYRSEYQSFGPVTAMNALYNATKNWSNVSSISFEYDDILDQQNSGAQAFTDLGYKGINVISGVGNIISKGETTLNPIGTQSAPLKARLPMYSEVYEKVDSNCNRLSKWLVINLEASSMDCYNDNEHIKGIRGYWLLDSKAVSSGFGGCTSRGVARYVNFDGTISATIANAQGFTNVCQGMAVEIYNGIRPVITVPISDLS